MVLIIDGEIVADNDPRAVAKRRSGGSSSSPSSAAPAGGPRRGGPNLQGLPPAGQQAPAPGGGAAGSPLDALANALGIQGQILTIPRLHARIPEREVPMVIAGLFGVATLIMGWRVLAAAAILHCVAGISETAPPAAPGGGGGGGATGGATGTRR